MISQRHFFEADNLATLQAVGAELEKHGFPTEQLHTLNLPSDTEAMNLPFSQVADIARKDLIRSGFVGAGIGLVLSIAVLAVTYMFQWHDSTVGWIPFIFLAVGLFGFCTWEGGLYGIQTNHHQFSQFQEAMAQGKIVFFLDVTGKQSDQLYQVVDNFPGVGAAAVARGTPILFSSGQRRLTRFLTRTMP